MDLATPSGESAELASGDSNDCPKVGVLGSVADPDPDPDPVGSVYYWLSWIRIRIRILYTDPDPDPAAEKLITNLNILNIL